MSCGSGLFFFQFLHILFDGILFHLGQMKSIKNEVRMVCIFFFNFHIFLFDGIYVHLGQIKAVESMIGGSKQVS